MLKWYSMPSYNLSSCSSEVGITLEGAHRAINDVEANAKMLIKFLRSLRGDGDGQKSYVRKKFKMNF